MKPYSVSPFLRDQSVGPKPTMYWVTFTPNFLAGTMCPISCSAIEASRPNAKISTPSVYSTVRILPQPVRSSDRSDARPRPSVGLFDVLDGTRVPDAPRAWSLSHSSQHVTGRCRRSAGSSIEPAWNAATSSSLAALNTAGAQPPACAGAPGQLDGRKRVVVERARTSSAAPCVQSTAAAASGTRSGQPSASAIGSRMSGGDSLGDRRAVGELDHRVDDRLRVHDHVDALVRDVEQQVRLDELQALVDQGRRVGGDQLAHVPRRVGQRLRRRDVAPARRGCGRGTGRRSPSAPAGAPRRPCRARRHCASAECSESTGTSWPGAARRVTSGPPAISDSLLASATVRPASSAASVARSPCAPATALSTTSQSQRGQLGRWRPGRRATRGRGASAGQYRSARRAAQLRQPSARLSPTARDPQPRGLLGERGDVAAAGGDARSTRNRSGAASATSIACVPIDPVEPSTTTLRAPITVPFCRTRASVPEWRYPSP